MRFTFSFLILLSLVTCTRIGTVKKMTLSGKAQTGVSSKAPVKTGKVSVVVPSDRGWQRLVFEGGSEIPNIVTTAADGTFTFSVEYNWWSELLIDEKRPAFLAVTDSTDSFTLLSPIPGDLTGAGETLTVDASPETTVAALWQCPHGVFSSPQPACPTGVVCQASGGMPCYELRDTSTTTADVVNAITAADSAASIPEPTNGNWGDYSTALLNADPELLAKIKQNLLDSGFTVEFEIDASFLAGEIAITALPKVPLPTSDDLNQPPAESGSGDAQCSAFLSCSGCSISACSNGESSYYKTSTGATFNCVSVGNCTVAANQVVAACCSDRESQGFPAAFPFLMH